MLFICKNIYTIQNYFPTPPPTKSLSWNDRALEQVLDDTIYEAKIS